MNTEIRRIKYTGKNLNDIFSLPCVSTITKYEGDPYLCLYPSMLVGIRSIAKPGCTLVEYENGLWEIKE